jgi:hypothetical protein
MHNANGAALIEGVSGMLLPILVVVAGVILVATFGTYMMCKIKVGFIANQAAQYAAGQLSFNTNYNPSLSTSVFPTPEQKVKTAIARMCSAVGLPNASSTKIADNGATVACTVTVSGFVQPYGMPIPIWISDTASADLTAYQPPAILELHPQNSDHSKFKYALPCYGFATQTKFRNIPKHKFTVTFQGPASFQ